MEEENSNIYLNTKLSEVENVNLSDCDKMDTDDCVDDASKNSGGISRENRLISIINQLRCANKQKGSGQRVDSIVVNSTNGEGGGGGGRRCVRDGPTSSPLAPPTGPSAAGTQPHPQPQAHPHTAVKCERLSPHDNQSTASRSRSVTPSTSSYPGTPPERGSPHGPAAAALPSASTAVPSASTAPRNYSDIMRSLAARYNAPQTNCFLPRMNGFAGGVGRTEPADTALGGLFSGLAKIQGGPPRLPAFPDMIDMTSTKTLLSMARVGRGGRDARRKRCVSGTNMSAAGAEHSPLDLSAASENAVKRARLSASPSTRSDSDDREHGSNDESRGDCRCVEAKSRLSGWTVDDVCDFVNSIDICAEYVMNFREQRIDGAGLPLLTEDHLTGLLQMKLGPALKLRAVLSSRLGPCVKCQNYQNGSLTTHGKINGSTVKYEPRSNTTSPS